MLLRDNGGINPVSELVERDTNGANIVIGIGGTGINCIRKIKTKLHSALGLEHPDPLFPTYSNIRFLGIDSDYYSQREGEYLRLNDSEYLSIGDPQGIGIQAFRYRPELSWLNHDLRVDFPTINGAGAIRQVGRLLLFEHAGSFISKLEHAIRAAAQEIANPNVNIFIISGLCGGTGSGCFLDVCYLTRMVLSNIGFNGQLHGLFFMPEVNVSRSPHNDRTYALEANGYAALQELNYCMALPENGGCFQQSYGDAIAADDFGSSEYFV